MFYHVKELQYNARVSKPDPRFARIMLEAFGGANGELKSALQYFVQAFACHGPYPDKYDMLMDIATEELAHLEIVGATIQMLLGPLNGEMKNALDTSCLKKMMEGKDAKEDLIHQAFSNPQFLVVTSGTPQYTDSNGNPFSGAYISANGELTVDLRSNMAGEARAKIGYEALLKFTEDPLVRETLQFLMAREVTHYQQFEAALATIPSNFPPGVLQTDPRYSNLYFNMSVGKDARGPWNEGPCTQMPEEWQYIEKPIEQICATNGELTREPSGTRRTAKEVREKEETLSRQKSQEVLKCVSVKEAHWCNYEQPPKCSDK